MAEATGKIGGRSGPALRAFAEQRGLTFTEKAELPPATPLLIEGDATTTDIVSGELPGFTGLLAACTFTHSTGSDAPTTQTEANVAMTQLRESVHYVPSLTARDATKRGFSERLVGAGGVIPIYDQLEFESIKFNHTYRVGVLKNQDESFIRQLFSPSFVDLLAERAPEGCYFDLMFGVLLVASNEPLTDLAKIERFCEFTAVVADRIRAECRESIETRTDARALVSKPLQIVEARRDEMVARVDWSEPPESVKEGTKPYRRFAIAKPMTWIGSIVISAIVAIIMAGIVAFFSIIFLEEKAGYVFLGLGAIFFVWTFYVILRGSIRHQTVDWGLAAFARGYGAQRGLAWEPGSMFAATHTQTAMPGSVAAALKGRMPGSERDGTLILSVDPSLKGRQMKGTMGMATDFAGPDSEAMIVLPKRTKDAPTPLGGFLVKGADGVKESDADRAKRERTERIGEQALDGDESLGIFLAGGELSVFTETTSALEWDAEKLDEFAKRAAAAAGRLEASLSAA